MRPNVPVCCVVADSHSGRNQANERAPMERRRSVMLFLLCSFCIGMWLIGCSSNGDPAQPEGPGNPCDPDPCDGYPERGARHVHLAVDQPSSPASAWTGTSGTWGRPRARKICAILTLACRSPTRCRARVPCRRPRALPARARTTPSGCGRGTPGPARILATRTLAGASRMRLQGTCEGFSADVFTCGCQTGYLWDRGTRACVDDLCSPDPCALDR